MSNRRDNQDNDCELTEEESNLIRAYQRGEFSLCDSEAYQQLVELRQNSIAELRQWRSAPLPFHYLTPPSTCTPCMPPKRDHGKASKNTQQCLYSKAAQNQPSSSTGTTPKNNPKDKSKSSASHSALLNTSSTFLQTGSSDSHILANPPTGPTLKTPPVAVSGETKRNRDDRRKDETTPSPEDQPNPKKVTLQDTPPLTQDLGEAEVEGHEEESNPVVSIPSFVRPQYSRSSLKATEYCILDSSWVRCFRPDVPYTLEELHNMGFRGDAKGRLKSIKEEDCEPLPDTIDELIRHIAQLDDFSPLKLLIEEATKGYSSLQAIHKYLQPLLGLSNRVYIQRGTYRAMERIKAFIEGARWADTQSRHLRARENLSNRRIQADTLNKIETVCESLAKNTEQLNTAFKQLEVLRAETKSSMDKRKLAATVPPLKYQTKANPWKSEKFILDLHLGVVTFTKNETSGEWEAKGDQVQVKHPDFCNWKVLVRHIRSFSKQDC